MRISPIPPDRSVFRSLSTTTKSLRNKPARTLVLLGLFAVAATALASSVSSTGSLRQLIFGSALSGDRGSLTQLKTAASSVPLNPAALPQSGSSTMTTERRAHTATILSDGRVLIVGGENASGGHLRSAEIFDPAASSFSLTGSITTGRADHAAVRLADGRVLISGGRTAIGATNTTEIFDHSTGTITNDS